MKFSHREGFYFYQVSIFYQSSHGSTGQATSSRSRTDSELLFHRTKLNFAGAQRDYFDDHHN